MNHQVSKPLREILRQIMDIAINITTYKNQYHNVKESILPVTKLCKSKSCLSPNRGWHTLKIELS